MPPELCPLEMYPEDSALSLFSPGQWLDEYWHQEDQEQRHWLIHLASPIRSALWMEAVAACLDLH